MAKEVVTANRLCVPAVCQTFDISESCYRYVGKLGATNALIATWLVRLTDNQYQLGL
jgi:putative transposase